MQQTSQQTMSECLQKQTFTYSKDSKEHKKIEDSILDMVINSGCALRWLNEPSVRKMFNTIDSKFSPLTTARAHSLLNSKHEHLKSTVKNHIENSRKLTICLDGWTKKGLNGSFIGVSASFYDTILDKPLHVFLNIKEVHHPHTGDKIADMLIKCFDEWGIPSKKFS